jgi:hypothetical protein
MYDIAKDFLFWKILGMDRHDVLALHHRGLFHRIEELNHSIVLVVVFGVYVYTISIEEKGPHTLTFKGDMSVRDAVPSERPVGFRNEPT